jgi:hypothetical protein
MSDEDYEATPDIRAFGFEITDADRNELLDNFAEITAAINEKTPPKLDLSRWTFNGFKTACANDLSEEEIEEIRKQVAIVRKSGLPEWKKRDYINALDFIEKVRSREAV